MPETRQEREGCGEKVPCAEGMRVGKLGTGLYLTKDISNLQRRQKNEDPRTGGTERKPTPLHPSERELYKGPCS